MGTYNDQLNKLFEEWILESIKNGEDYDDTEEHNIIFTKDGLMEKDAPNVDIESLWEESDKKIMFILKDQPSKYCDDTRLWLKDSKEDNEYNRKQKEKNRQLKPRFLRNIANVFWGLNNATPYRDCYLSEAPKNDIINTFKNKPFAFVESKKQGGGTYLSDKKLKLYLIKYGHFLMREIAILKPNMIVCTGEEIYNFIIGQYPEEELIRLDAQKHNSIRIHPQSGTLIFCSFHPSARKSYEEFYEGVMDHYRAFQHSEFALTKLS